MKWRISHRADPVARRIADRHYSRQKVGTPQFVQPGSCLVLLALANFNEETNENKALWVTSWPQYTKHAWPAAWVCSLFRNESDWLASELIRQAVAATRYFYGTVPPSGMVTFINRSKVRPTLVRGKSVYGWTYRKAGFREVGQTKGGLLVLQLLPPDMPAPVAPMGYQERLAM